MLIKVVAPNTTTGNPRRGWVYVDDQGAFVTFIDEGYEGSAAIQHFVDAGQKETFSIKITPKQYNEFIKRERTCA